jgi:hypothetical protein
MRLFLPERRLQMNLLSSFANPTERAIAIVLLMILLVGCGGNPVNTHVQNSVKQSLPTDKSNDLTPNKGASIDTAGLHIQSSDGIQCGESLVFATTRLTYDSGEIKQMAAYLDAYWNHKKYIPPVPPTLTLVQGSQYAGNCSLDLQITNVGETAVQIPRVDIRITKPPHQNTYQYHLIDACKLIECGESGAGVNPCSGYQANIKLGKAASKDTVFTGEVTSFPGGTNQDGIPCGPLTLTQGESTELFYYLKLSHDNLIYSAIPELTLETSSGSYMLQLSRLAGTLVYTDESEFTCYTLDRQSQTFVKEDPYTYC